VLRRDVPPRRAGTTARLIGAAIALVPAVNFTWIAVKWYREGCYCGSLMPSWSWFIALVLAAVFYAAAAAIATTAVLRRP
jgi:hypothetical protein